MLPKAADKVLWEISVARDECMTGYKTLDKKGASEFAEKRSRFIGTCVPVTTEEEALGFIASVRDAHKTASHNVFAYCLRENNICRFSDDGEPQGTAGMPVLDVLKRGEITDAAIVVTRYFGGTLLGTGGLVRAYGEAAALAVRDAGIAVMELCSIYRMELDYPIYDRMQKVVESSGASIVSSTFGEKIVMDVAVLNERAQGLIAAVSELTRGGSDPGLLYERYEKVN